MTSSIRLSSNILQVRTNQNARKIGLHLGYYEWKYVFEVFTFWGPLVFLVCYEWKYVWIFFILASLHHRTHSKVEA